MSVQNKQKGLVNPNESATMPESVVLPKELQEGIDNFFFVSGELTDMEERGWSFLETAANGLDVVGFGGKEISDWMFLYRRFFDLVKTLHNYKTTKELSNQTHTII